MVVCLIVCGKEAWRISTFADKEINIKIEDQWAWRWLGPLQQLFNGDYNGFSSF